MLRRLSLDKPFFEDRRSKKGERFGAHAPDVGACTKTFRQFPQPICLDIRRERGTTTRKTRGEIGLAKPPLKIRRKVRLPAAPLDLLRKDPLHGAPE